MEFTYQQNRDWNCAARRSVVMSRNGMVASSQNLASLTGYKILARGGNAIDAAVGMLCTLSVVEPHSVGIGGDAFAIIYSSKDDHLYGMNASGRAPSKANVSWFLQQGFAKVPEDGILSVTIPGALDGWIKAVERFGKLTISEIFEDAIYYAENGFPVTEIISGEWQASESKIKSDRYLNQIYTVNGRIAQPGDVIRNPDLAKTYKLIVDNGSEIFYQGIIAKAIVNFSASKNGLIEMEDLHNHRTTWVDPISFNYRGYEVWELPPNTQGITALEILNILEGYDLNSFGFTSAEYYHLLIEAKKLPSKLGILL
jgi:gamma-glutamyltranspeptidase/glutathione hydrolase